MLFVLDGPGFHVDVAVIDEAATGVTQSVHDQSGFALRGLCGDPELYGHVPLHDALMDFCVRWSGGMDDLTSSAGALGDALTRVGAVYGAIDGAAAKSLTADPAVGATGG
jgi:hypothetical protein